MHVLRLVVLPALLSVMACAQPSQPAPAPTQPAAKPAPTTATVASPAAASPVAGSPVPAAAASPSPASKPAAAPSPSPLAAPGRWTFDNDPVGGLPNGAQSFSGQWAVRAEADAPSQPNALCQTGTADFPALALDMGAVADLTLSTRFKAISGREDQAAGLIFRVQDKDNYYILRANALEDNVNFYIYRGGRRSGLRGADVQVPAGSWQELRVDVQGNQFRGFLNGQQVAESSDDIYKTGGIGLWTKADSVTCFDDVQLTASR
jgi:hypothetical protein